MNKKIFVMIILMSHSVFSMAHILISKPYIKITNSISGQVYKIKPSRKIELILNDDSVLIKDRIESFSGNNSIILGNGKQVSLNQISYIRFKPKSKGLRITKMMFYTLCAGAMTVLAYENTNPGGDPNFQSMPLMPVFFVSAVSFIAIAEVGECVFNLCIQKRELFKNKNLKLEIVTK